MRTLAAAEPTTLGDARRICSNATAPYESGAQSARDDHWFRTSHSRNIQAPLLTAASAQTRTTGSDVAMAGSNSKNATHLIPTPVGGAPDVHDQVASVLFAALYLLLLVAAVARVCQRSARTWLICTTIGVVTERVSPTPGQPLVRRHLTCIARRLSSTRSAPLERLMKSIVTKVAISNTFKVPSLWVTFSSCRMLSHCSDAYWSAQRMARISSMQSTTNRGANSRLGTRNLQSSQTRRSLTTPRHVNDGVGGPAPGCTFLSQYVRSQISCKEPITTPLSKTQRLLLPFRLFGTHSSVLSSSCC